MAQKSQEKGSTGGVPVVTEPDKVRNVVLVGHSGAGKTTLVEALLAATGTIGRAGSVLDGTTVGDHDPAAVRQQRSVSLSCAPLLHNGIKVNLLDTPGTPTSSASCAPGYGPPTPRSSSCPPSTGWTRPPRRSGTSARRSTCPEPSRSPGWTTRVPTSTTRWRSASGSSATT
ncbi:hypothetical protein GCM10027614_75820 [Micromonospora vulcania]